MHFHKRHGSAIVLSEHNGVAVRTEDFCNGVAFSAQCLKIGQKVCVELIKATEWSGALRIGVTTQDPALLSPDDIPNYACPDLTNKEGYWARALSENYADTGNRITVYVDEQGQMHYFVNNEHKGLFLNHLPTIKPLWMLFDIYGNTKSAKFVPADEAPVEILARGPDAMRVYHESCQSGTQPVFRTRLMLVGQDRVGKTSLKKALTGQRHNTQEESTDGIDLSASCSFNLRDRKAWKLAMKGDIQDTFPKITISKPKTIGVLGGIQGLEEEYHRAIANNIVQELLFKKRQRQKEAEENRAKEEKSQTKRTQQRSASKEKKKIKEFKKDEGSVAPDAAGQEEDVKRSEEELLREMPLRVVEMVEAMLKEKEEKDDARNTAATDPALPLLDNNESNHHSGRNIVLNIWDFAGQAVYYTTHQVFLSSRAVYVIVFHLCHDLEELAKTQVRRRNNASDSDSNDEWEEGELTNLDYMDYWMSSIHAHTAQNTRNSVDNTTISPPIFIVGTHRNSLASDPDVQDTLVGEIFDKIRDRLKGRSYWRHVVNKFYAVENSIDGEDDQVVQLRRHIEAVASKEPYMGEQMPIKWLKFEQAISKLVEEGAHYVSLEQIREVAKEERVILDGELKTMLEFYHDLGVIVHYGGASTLDTTLQNTVILQPQWLVDMFKQVITVQAQPQEWGAYMDLWHRLEEFGILEDELISQIWKDVLDQKPALLGLMEKFDLICPRLPPKSHQNLESVLSAGKSYYVPSRIKKTLSSTHLFTTTKTDVVFYMDFMGFLPDGLFHRVLTRAIRWSQHCGGQEPRLYHRRARFYLDQEHDFLLEMQPIKYTRLKVGVLRVADLAETDDTSSDSGTEKPLPPPDPAACAKVRNFLDSVLSGLRAMWMRRICYKAGVVCTCDKQCSLHKQPYCKEDSCIHLLDLDECLTNKIVCCEHRRIKTSQFRKWFPAPQPIVREGPVLADSIVQEANRNLIQDIEASKGSELPSWVKGAAKLLNGGSEGQDWTALAKKLGYKKNKIEKMNNDLNPGLMLITDWIVTSGNTNLSVDMMIKYLEEMQRDDIVEIIQKGQESELDPPQVFISYQWDSQDEVKALREQLEKCGFTCWMDIGQMGGGDQLNVKIDEGIRNAKVVIACVTPKYIVSHHCNRELGLADLLRKHIIPVMFDRVPWPPPGGMALTFSQLIYINMKGIGGHGGYGIHADLEDKYNEIVQKILRHISPMHPVPEEEHSVHDEKSGQSQSTLQSESHHSNSPSSDLTIPGYAAPYANPGQQRRASRTSNNNTNMRGPNDRVPVEQVHVSKCAVCCIL